jgi:hypothetical protein
VTDGDTNIRMTGCISVIMLGEFDTGVAAIRRATA